MSGRPAGPPPGELVRAPWRLGADGVMGSELKRTPRLGERAIRSRIASLGLVAAVAAGVAAGAGPAHAGPPVALVEDAGPQVSGLGPMDYLAEGRRLDLGSGGWIEIDYFLSCLHERIVGGAVTIGHEKSDVAGGAVERNPVECDAGKVALTEPQAERAAGFVQRGGAELKSKIRAMTKGQLVLRGASPLVIGDGAHPVVIAPFGDSRDAATLPAPGGVFRAYDYAAYDRSLTPGQVYVATCGDRQVTFRIDHDAKPGRTPALGRLVAFPPAP
jgi:hypothetical protein